MKNFVFNEGYQKNNFFDGAKGSYIFIKKKKYLDLACCSGANMLGHNTDISKKIFKNFNRKNISNISAPNIQSVNYAKNVKKILPKFSKFVFCNSGSESNIKAVRIARAISGKDMVVSTTGSWHGSIDQFLYSSDKKLNKIKLSDGLSEVDKKRLILIPYNNIDKSKKIFSKFRNKISCILIEPIQGCLPLPESKKYLKFLYNFSKKNKILLIFDEIITGLRTNCKSLQEHFNIQTDISTFGKVFGSGVPIGFIAITKKIEKILLKKKLSVYFGGTFSGNSQNMFFADEHLKHIIKNKNKIFKKINNNASYMQIKINNFCKKNSLDVRVYRYMSILRIVFSKKIIKDRQSRDFFEKNKSSNIVKFKNFLFKNNIYYPNNGIIFISASHSKSEISYAANVIIEGLRKFFQ